MAADGGTGGAVTSPEESRIELRLTDGAVPRSVHDLWRALRALLDAGPSAVVVDLSGPADLSSDTVSALLWIHRWCEERAVPVVLRHPSRSGLALLARSGLLSVVRLESSREARR